MIEANGLNERIEVLSGSFLENVPSGYDTIVMKHIIHDWPDDACLTILKNCRESLQAGNKLFIVDAVIEKGSLFFRKTYDF